MDIDPLTTVPTPEPEKPKRNRHRLILIGGIVAVVWIALSAVAWNAITPHRHIIVGELTLVDSDVTVYDDQTCAGTGGYDDFGDGMNVTIRDASDKVIASGVTANAKSPKGDGDVSILTDMICKTKFAVEVPDADFYQVQVGHRGTLSYRKAELEKKDWKVELSLG